MRIFTRKAHGFTLVELLIVVAIIGILATIGIPTFRQMVQKAKKSEAKVGLGALYTVETAFFGEYGIYGNHLDRIGFELEGQAINRIYNIGFPAGTNCGDAGISPAQGSDLGNQLQQAFQQYYVVPVMDPPLAQPRTIFLSGRPTGFCEAAAVTANNDDFLASATGVIAPGVNPPNATQNDVDSWTIDRTRNLRNVRDGVRR